MSTASQSRSSFRNSEMFGGIQGDVQKEDVVMSTAPQSRSSFRSSEMFGAIQREHQKEDGAMSAASQSRSCFRSSEMSREIQGEIRKEDGVMSAASQSRLCLRNSEMSREMQGEIWKDGVVSAGSQSRPSFEISREGQITAPAFQEGRVKITNTLQFQTSPVRGSYHDRTSAAQVKRVRCISHSASNDRVCHGSGGANLGDGDPHGLVCNCLTWCPVVTTSLQQPC